MVSYSCTPQIFVVVKGSTHANLPNFNCKRRDFAVLSTMTFIAHDLTKSFSVLS